MLILQDYEQLENLFEQGTRWLIKLLKDQAGKETRPFEISVRQIDTLTKLLLCEKLDRYINHRIATDKTLIGILMDIQGSADTLSQTMECINNVGIVCHDANEADRINDFLNMKGRTDMDEINEQDTGNQAEPEKMDPAPAEPSDVVKEGLDKVQAETPPAPAEPETPAPAEPRPEPTGERTANARRNQGDDGSGIV